MAQINSDVEKIKNAIEERKTVLIHNTQRNFNQVLPDLIRYIAESDTFLIYVSVRQGCDVLKEFIEKENIKKENLLFVDMITKTPSNRPERKDNCIFTNTPTNLTDAAMAISQALVAYQNKKMVLVVDDIDSLVEYNPLPTVAKFMQFIITRGHAANVSVLLNYTDRDMIKFVIENISDKVDYTVHL